MKNANCPKDQYMVVNIASFRGLLGTKTCGLSDDYSCDVDVTCLVKKQCDGLHECSINVDGNLFSADLCPGLSNYLYFEYQCDDTVKTYKEPCGMHGYEYDILLMVTTCLTGYAQNNFLWYLKMLTIDLSLICHVHVPHILETFTIILHGKTTFRFSCFCSS